MLKFKFADIGEGLTEGVVGEINVQVGDKIKDGQTMFSVETDKVNAEIPSPVDGTITKINMKVGDTIFVGDVVIEIDDGSGDSASPSSAPPADTKPAEEEKAAGVVGAVPISNTVIAARSLPATNNSQTVNSKVLATPVARRMASDLKVDLTKIQGTGPNGRIKKSDIQNASHHSGGPVATGPTMMASNITMPNIKTTGQVNRVPMSPIRKAIAKQMTLSKTVIPETTLIKNVDVTKLIELRSQLKPQAEKQGIKLTFMPFFIKACAIALQEFAMLNSSYDQQTEEVVYKQYYNIGMAVDTPRGLMVPVIKGADQLHILQIAHAVNDLAERTRDGKLKMDEMSDGTFTITNFGSAGVEIATPVINYPEAAILGVGTIEKKPTVDKENNIVIKSILPLSLSIDHRLIDGADGGRFLMRLNELLESPALLLL
ncbi:dihydrolipoamide acetyltransferase family protein [Spiroplasma eriocheiris]|uniref:Dihydrolipoamide acetyltransferase component of pyruvate dehydrogenase complex n=1 Tax=Spiroplasma eriocheiris TaxID=315358 RepID=A0A0H3XHS3_9MOLU|nr:dihydrolipoamide acetyltransferase family protein [Spiroplasma eriocheiris]AHF57468.1 pyruvate dehydrogenase E2 (dihydrolipoamide acetyltransferase) component [Spiroplasma eriocheiris CCTCC M 207170]AKM53925.1 pyruvate dehydrogenase E2 component (dihydrolipoamide acetyltransferase) [Spiroplasma eriocheiris]